MFNWIKQLFSGVSHETVVTENHYKLGSLREDVDYRDITVDQLPRLVLDVPDYHLTSLSMIPVTDQKMIGSCVGHAEGTYIEYLNHKELNNKGISRRFVYANCKRFDGIVGEGTQPRIASSVLRNFGASTTQYIPDDNLLSHSDFIDIQKNGTPYEIAKKYRVKGYALIRNTDAESLKKALVQFGLVTVTLPVDWSTGWKSKTGFLNKTPSAGSVVGYHRVILYGYSTHDGETIFNFRNSWGQNWGKSGNGTLLYSKYVGKIYDPRVYTDIPQELLDNAQEQKYMFTKTLRVGSTGNDVLQLQKVLGIEQNGLFDEFMKEQVALYQTLHSLSADGIVGPKTREMLNGIVLDGYKPSVKDVAEAIKIHEGWFKGSRSQRNQNPGNLRYAKQLGTTGQDDKGFAIFKTYDDGFAALCKLITNARDGKSKVYKPEMSLVEFFSVYAPAFDHNDPNAYAKFVAQKLKVSIDFKIKDLV